MNLIKKIAALPDISKIESSAIYRNKYEFINFNCNSRCHFHLFTALRAKNDLAKIMEALISV